MTKPHYKAYISYSHKDEAWAAWLHRAIESYRVPRKLVGRETTEGVVPARVRPVFRDRDDLSSSADLKDTVKQALADSDNLIVVCSPEAANSRWVGEEIRQFSRLGRGQRIFCIIVGGERPDDGSVSNCFPAALTEIGLEEPLAADVRKWADGKQVAKLKLIAGLLGIRLDELRQRDLQRRRKRRVATGLALAAAATLAVMTVISQISERHEREQAEQLATFIVDLGERLQSDADLETRALIGEQAAKYLENLNTEKLSAETGQKVALAFRQLGMVSQGQGKPWEALEAFQRSLDLLSTLAGKYPDNTDLLFQLGNAEYYVGNLYHQQGDHDNARSAMQEYHRITQLLLERDPQNPDWIMELSYSHNNLAALQLDYGFDFDEETQRHVEEAVRLAKIATDLKPESRTFADGYTTVLAWAADAQKHGCNLDKAMVLRKQVLELRETSSRANPGNNDLKRRYAYDLTGLGRLHFELGQLDMAKLYLKQAISILQGLSLADPSNLEYRTDILSRQLILARLMAEENRMVDAQSMLKEIESALSESQESAYLQNSITGDYTDFLLSLADLEFRNGEAQAANQLLLKVKQLQMAKSESRTPGSGDWTRLQRAKYQWWIQNGQQGLEQFAVPPGTGNEYGEKVHSCEETDVAARISVMSGDRKSALDEVGYLQAKGYAEPGFLRFCKNQELCS
jgi:tetratricopeptide (TPR) repeat protein